MRLQTHFVPGMRRWAGAMVLTALVLCSTRTVCAHWQMSGSSLDVVIHRDRIDIRASITPAEVNAIAETGGDSPAELDRQLDAYAEFLVSHLHVSADGTELAGKVLSTKRAEDKGGPSVCELEYRNPVAAAAIWEQNAKTGMVVIRQNLLEDRPRLWLFISGITYAVRAAQEGWPAEENSLTESQEFSFGCNWERSARPAPAPDSDSISPTAKKTPAAEPNIEQRLHRVLESDSLSLPALLGAILGAMIWGAAHSLTPGHGKALVGAYLVGSRGTAAHALYLSLTVTITHTLIVFALGLIAVLASRCVPPFALFPWLSLASGLIILGLGASMLLVRLRAALAGSGHDHGHSHPHHDGDHSHEHVHGQDSAGGHVHQHGHDHEGGHHHDRHHHHHHDHERRGHSHLPPGADGQAVNWRSLLGLGISGGLLPCPSALVLLLAAIAVNRTGLGLLLVLAFSVGLAGVLTVVGLMFIKGKRLLGKLPWAGALGRYLPAISALVIFVLGCLLTFQAAYSLLASGRH